MYEIYLGIKRKWSISRISREIEVSATTVLREIRRNSNANGYNPLEINLKNVVSKNVTVKLQVCQFLKQRNDGVRNG